MRPGQRGNQAMDRSFHSASTRFAALGCLIAISLSGCRSFSLFGASDGDAQVQAMTSTEDITGPLERMVSWATERKSKERLESTPDYYQKGQDEFARAKRTFESRDFAAAEKELRVIVGDFEEYAVKEDALFLLGDACYAQQKYPQAQDAFDELVKDFPGTKYKRQISKRLFDIAGIWLDFPDVVKTSDIQLAGNIEEAGNAKIPQHQRSSWDPTLKVPFLPNLHDSTRPHFDTEGRALEALKSIWLNDPSSDLADDALMMTASHHLREGNNVRADEYFAALRQNYPNSPHFQNAFILGSHVKLMSYEGADYDGTRLEESQQLKESALKIWPNHTLSGRLEDELKRIENEKAKREWETAQFWLKKGRKDSAAIYCREVIRLYPDSAYAERARKFLAENGQNIPRAEQKKDWDWTLFPKLEKIPSLPKPPKLSLPKFGSDDDESTSPDDDSTGRVAL
jgi:outer membrane protein assembly factor BamD (BamD/ComL family)